MAVFDNEPLVSVIVLNYNGMRWLDRCLDSLRRQTLLPQTEIILADNLSSDGSDRLAEKLVSGWPNAFFIQHGENLGYCEGNNRAAQRARGRYLFFLNNDTWLEPNCLQVLLNQVESAQAQAATPLVLNYEDSSFQSLGAGGLDLFGLTTARLPFTATRPVFMPEGCSYLIERRVFEELGGFDPVLFMFSDELDLSWRLWTAGYQAIGVPAARLHHRGAANVNPQGVGQVTEFRTSDTKRFYANRNGLMVVAKNAGNILLLLLPLQVGLLLLEAMVGWVLVRRWSFVQQAYLRAFGDCWRLRHHLVQQRRQISARRRRSDWWLLRFLRLRPNRWDELVRVARYGLPKVTAQ
jgi:GT2 family glycosyltransferase